MPNKQKAFETFTPTNNYCPKRRQFLNSSHYDVQLISLQNSFCRNTDAAFHFLM